MILLICALNAGAQVKFSVYLAPRASVSGDSKELGIVNDLHYAVGERNVPIYVKEGRQSIEFPWNGGNNLVLFRLEEGAEGVVRVPVVNTTIPSGSRSGVLILTRKEERFGVTPVWLTAQQERKGTAVIYNMSGRKVGLTLDGGKGTGLGISKSHAITGKFKSGQEMAFHKMEAYLSKKREGREDRMVKVLSRSIAIPRDSSVLLLLLPKQGDFLTVTTLSSRGVPDADRERELINNLPKPKEGANGG